MDSVGTSCLNEIKWNNFLHDPLQFHHNIFNSDQLVESRTGRKLINYSIQNSIKCGGYYLDEKGTLFLGYKNMLGASLRDIIQRLNYYNQDPRNYLHDIEELKQELQRYLRIRQEMYQPLVDPEYYEKVFLNEEYMLIL